MLLNLPEAVPYAGFSIILGIRATILMVHLSKMEKPPVSAVITQLLLVFFWSQAFATMHDLIL